MAVYTRFFRWLIATGGIVFFSWWFFKISFPKFSERSLSVQIINNMPHPLDIYAIKISNDPEARESVSHVGVIRPAHYRIEYFKVKNMDEYWLMGFIGKRQLVYFSQNMIFNKNEDQLIEIRNYINQSHRLSDMGVKAVSAYVDDTVTDAIWVTLDLLLLFLNIALLLRKKPLAVEY
ncbi:hypothetical protein GNY06_07985 [Elizabethkingia argentiflava]|uniref:Uncharacterized protein n=1 Tax=Elizabethkingia argenteiflava TaxID=2681556 RepID=A0A845PZ08_9FLAO|nr:hypothetical protein [Elizabethkingia argenteiflava]